MTGDDLRDASFSLSAGRPGLGDRRGALTHDEALLIAKKVMVRSCQISPTRIRGLWAGPRSSA